MARIFDDPHQQAMQEWVESTCPYCGQTGCDEGCMEGQEDYAPFCFRDRDDEPSEEDPAEEEKIFSLLEEELDHPCSVCGKQGEGMAVDGKDYCWDHLPYNDLPWPECHE